MLELAVLGLLKERPMHGYEIKKQLTRKLGHFWQVSFGSLYPALKRLEERGAVESVFSGESTRRRRNVYRITEQGEREFLQLIEDRAQTSWEEDKFPLRLAFFRYLKPDMRIRLLERRRADLIDKLDELRASLEEAVEPIDGYTLSLLRHGMEATERDITWLDEMIAAERRLVEEASEPSQAAETTSEPGRAPRPATGGPAAGH